MIILKNSNLEMGKNLLIFNEFSSIFLNITIIIADAKDDNQIVKTITDLKKELSDVKSFTSINEEL